ncbi:XkdQ/YqbQ family protein [Bacillus chungangensis]|uniref:RNA-binding protein YlxR (DUF448 family) n=1 Tax=Bacillus chungangensis TaxID=587633 RepID=A0ABT9WRQ7_9BACI|nr:hypothetical protein [Bacillus chungangensis]MDQ0175978.1 putative RNA-binding protein YlxR (DUF448 family) [Bacillus chungangensis]
MRDMEILVDNKNGTVWNMTEVVSDLTWKTTRIGKAASIEFNYIDASIYQDPWFTIKNGDIVRVKYKGTNVFYGYIFTIDGGKDEAVKITAYDQTRYLMNKDTYVFKNVTATQVIQKIASDLNLKTSKLEDTKYNIPTLVEDDQSLMDIICKALDATLIATTQNYVLFDDFGQLTVRNIKDMVSDFVIGDDSLMTDFDYKLSIDSDTYNRIKIVQDNKETKKRDVYITQDSKTIAKWGRLQYFQKANEKLNAAQINDMMKRLLEHKNREQKTMSIKAIGDIRIRAGYFVPVIIEKKKINSYFLVDECTHEFNGDDHTMTLSLKVI